MFDDTLGLPDTGGNADRAQVVGEQDALSLRLKANAALLFDAEPRLRSAAIAIAAMPSKDRRVWLARLAGHVIGDNVIGAENANAVIAFYHVSV